MLETGKTYQLSADGDIYGEYQIIDIYQIKRYQIIPPLKGELKITHLDFTNQIVSGTFWFDAVNDKGEKVAVRAGRFDTYFTK